MKDFNLYDEKCGTCLTIGYIASAAVAAILAGLVGGSILTQIVIFLVAAAVLGYAANRYCMGGMSADTANELGRGEKEAPPSIAKKAAAVADSAAAAVKEAPRAVERAAEAVTTAAPHVAESAKKAAESVKKAPAGDDDRAAQLAAARAAAEAEAEAKAAAAKAVAALEAKKKAK